MLNSLLWGEDPEIRVKISAGSLHQQWGWQTPQLKSSFNSRCVVCPLWLVAPQPGHRMIPVFMDPWMTTSPLKMYLNTVVVLLLFWSHLPYWKFYPTLSISVLVCLLTASSISYQKHRSSLEEWKKPKEKVLYILSLFYGSGSFQFNSNYQSRNIIMQTKDHLNR